MKICICGYGSIGQRHGRILKELGHNFDIISVDYPDSNGDYDKDYDLVLICTPTSNHLDSAKLFKNSKSFFIEKAFDSDFNKIKNSKDFFCNKKLYVGYNFRHTIFFETLKKQIEDLNEKIDYINVINHSFMPEWRKKKDPNCYSFHKSLGGGAILDLSHELDYVYQLFGKPINIKSYSARIGSKVTVDCDDYCISIWEYENFVIKMDLNLFTRQRQRCCQIFDEDSTFYEFDISLEDTENSYFSQMYKLINNQLEPENYDEIIEFNKILYQMENNESFENI